MSNVIITQLATLSDVDTAKNCAIAIKYNHEDMII